MSTVALIPCPACGGAMEAHAVTGLLASVCADCGGAWFGSGQLDFLVKHGSAALDQLVALEPTGAHDIHGVGTAKCPCCNLDLKPSSYAGKAPVHLSACYQCGGVFIDAQSILALDAETHGSSAPAGSGTFGQQGTFAATGVPAPPQSKIHAISNSLFRRRPGPYAVDEDDAVDRVGTTLIGIDIAATIADIFFGG